MTDRLTAIHLGVDFGASHDRTALALCEVRERTKQLPPLPPDAYGVPQFRDPTTLPSETWFRVQLLDQMPINTPFKAQAEHIWRLLLGVWTRFEQGYTPHGFASPNVCPPRYVYLDATGLGLPVIELVDDRLKSDPRTRDVWLYPLVYRAGDKFDRSAGQVGKVYLVSNLQALLAARRIELPQHDTLADELRRQIADFRITINESGNWVMGNKPGGFDDLVNALGLAVVDSGPRAVTVSPMTWDWAGGW